MSKMGFGKAMKQNQPFPHAAPSEIKLL